ncbi:MAG: DUF4870 domain-containing protein [Nonlabens sp.]
METTHQKNHNTISACIHLLTFGKWVFPLGNFVLPIILWMVNSNKSSFIDKNGREALNFQISITLYTVVLAFIGGGVIIGTMISGGPVFWENIDNHSFLFTENVGIFSTVMASGIICGTSILALAIIDVVCTIKAALAAREGDDYCYPITINFVRKNEINESTNKESL